MAEAEKVMGVSADDIEKIMGVAKADIEKMMGVEVPSGPGWLGDRHFMAGLNFDPYHDIFYKSSTSSGNTAAFGDLDYGRDSPRGAGTGSGGARGIIGGGHNSVADERQAAYDYIACNTLANAQDGGDADAARSTGSASSNGTLLFFVGGIQDSPYARTDDMEYITIASLGSGTDAGNLIKYNGNQGFVSGDTRGAFFAGLTGDTSSGYANSNYQAVDYITFHTSNNAADFGDCSNKSGYGSACASETRWVYKLGSMYSVATGSVYFNNMDYFTAASTGNYSDFGDISGRTDFHAGMGDGTRGEFWGGRNDTPAFIDSIAYITIASTGDGTDAGNIHSGSHYTQQGGFSGSS